MHKGSGLFAGVAVAATLFASGVAGAQDRPVRQKRPAHAVTVAHIGTFAPPPLTVKKRSFLDPGNVVAPGSETPEYVAANTVENRQVYTSFNPSYFGESTLPGRFDLPNNPRFFPNQDLDFSPF